jgi:hypothetical protein
MNAATATALRLLRPVGEPRRTRDRLRLLRPVGPSAASRSGTASVEPGTADIAWLNAAVEQPSVLALSSRRALRAKPYSQERLNLYAPRQPAPIGS